MHDPNSAITGLQSAVLTALDPSAADLVPRRGFDHERAAADLAASSVEFIRLQDTLLETFDATTQAQRRRSRFTGGTRGT